MENTFDLTAPEPDFSGWVTSQDEIDFSLAEHINRRLDKFITSEAKSLIGDILYKHLDEIINKYVSRRISSITDEHMDEILATSIYRLFKHESQAIRWDIDIARPLINEKLDKYFKKRLPLIATSYIESKLDEHIKTILRNKYDIS